VISQERARSCHEVAKLLGIYKEPKLEDFEKGIRQFHKEHGRHPLRKDGDATRYLGYRTTWKAASDWLVYREHPSLRRLCEKMGLVSPRMFHSVEVVENGIHKYWDDYGKPPGQKGGDATKYLGCQTTWAAVNMWLRAQGHGSLFQITQRLGLRPAARSYQIRSVKKAIRKFHAERGEAPTYRGGDAAKYFGQPSSWMGVNTWLRGNGFESLFQLCKNMGLEGAQKRDTRRVSYVPELIEEGLRRYLTEHGEVPFLGGDASVYLGPRTTWAAAQSWLRRHGHGSLRGFYNSQQRDCTLERIQRGIRQYRGQQGEFPTRRSGSAFSYTGRVWSWNAVAAWLKDEGHGTLHQICRVEAQSLGLLQDVGGHSLEGIEKGIRRYHREHGRLPSSTTGEASSYFGSGVTWAAVNSWLWHRGHDGVHRFGTRLGLK